jgi:DNA helicase-2/ATP-dependent DNA helicase PcrA
VVGHNIGFDLNMIRASSARHGAPLRPRTGFDTLRFARRLLRLPNHRLGTLVAALQLPAQATHRAIDDVLATVHLISALAERAAAHAHERRMLLLRDSPLFARLRARLDTWAEADLRPADLIERIALEAIRPKLPKDEWTRRAPHIQELAARVRRMDRPELSPAEALRRVLDRAALAPDAEDAGPRVRVLTMHQSKGLEFDQVFLPGLTEGNLPSYQALRDEDAPALEEERRVFYVALTRARLGLHLSCATLNDRQRTIEPSRFLAPLRPHLRPLPTPIDNPSPSGEAETP